MWFLIRDGMAGAPKWRYARIMDLVSKDIQTVKRVFRDHGLPILAIARRKARPQSEPYDDVRDD